MATDSKDFKVKNGLIVAEGGTFGGTVTVATPTSNTHAATKLYVDDLLASGGSGSITVSDTAPSNPSEGDLWYNSTDGSTYVYYDSFWVESTSAYAGPTGMVAASAPLSFDEATSTLTIDLSSYYTSAETDAAIAVAVSSLVDSAPATLDTLNELSAALNDNENFATTVTNSLATKASANLLVEEATTKSLSANDANKLFINTSSSDQTLTIPVDDGTVFANGFKTKILQSGSGKIILQPGSASASTWSTTSIQNLTSIVGLASNSTTIIAADASGNVYRSQDGGASSTLVATVPNNFSDVVNAVFNSANSNTFLIVTKYTLHISTDDGQTFSAFNNLPLWFDSQPMQLAEAVCSTDGKFLMATALNAGYEAILYSSDFGASWVKANSPGANNANAAVAYSEYFNSFYLTLRHDSATDILSFRIAVYNFSGGTITGPTKYYSGSNFTDTGLNYGFYKLFVDGTFFAMAAPDGIYALDNGSDISDSNPMTLVHSWSYTSSSPSDITRIVKSGNSYYAFRGHERNASTSSDGINWTDISVGSLNYSTPTTTIIAMGTDDAVYLYDGTDLQKAGLLTVLLNGLHQPKTTVMQNEIIDLVKIGTDSWQLSGPKNQQDTVDNTISSIMGVY